MRRSMTGRLSIIVVIARRPARRAAVSISAKAAPTLSSSGPVIVCKTQDEQRDAQPKRERTSAGIAHGADSRGTSEVKVPFRGDSPTTRRPSSCRNRRIVPRRAAVHTGQRTPSACPWIRYQVYEDTDWTCDAHWLKHALCTGLLHVSQNVRSPSLLTSISSKHIPQSSPSSNRC